MLLWVCARVGLVLLAIAGTTAWGSLALRGANHWVCRVTRGMWTDDIQTVPVRDVAIVPGVMFRNGKPNSFQLQRLELALELYRAGRVPAILVSGDEERAGKEATGMRQWLIDHGVPADRVTADPLGTRTLVTMNRAAQVFGVRNAVICTQGVYAPRTAFLARAAGIEATVLVPRTAPRRSRFNNEPFKVTLAFVERYILRRTGAEDTRVAMVPAALAARLPASVEHRQAAQVSR